MALLGVPPEVMRPTALALNILVATIASVKFQRAGHFDRRLFLWLALGSVPLAFVGGRLDLPIPYFRAILGLVLAFVGLRMIWPGATTPAAYIARPPRPAVATSTGAGIGLLSGLTGVGGGIFLSPLMLWRHWAEPRRVSGIAAPFILVNSVAGLAGVAPQLTHVPPYFGSLALACVAGGWIGSELGSKRFDAQRVRRALGAVMLVAALKMFIA
jgi:hypothetical protein